MNVRRKALFGLCLLFASATLAAQKPAGGKSVPTASYKLISLKVTGSNRYTEKEILPASGLELGQNVGDADFKEAVRRLGDSGLFTDIAYSYSFSPAGTKLEFQLTDAGPETRVPIHFENFVWFTDTELVHELQLRVPLYKDQLPVGGSMPDRVEAALQAILDEKRIPARVDYLRESPPEGEKLTGIAYSVEAMGIRIRNVEFPGATPDLLPGLQAAARRLAGAPYRRSPLSLVAKVDFLPVCLKRGYLKASFAAADARVASQSEGDVEVDAIFQVAPGKIYSTSAVDWKGNSVVKTDDLQTLLHLPLGKPADAVQLITDLENAIKLYRARGYMVARITPHPTLDDEKSAVHYELEVAEGDQFKMGDLEIVGLDSQAKAHLQAEWKLQEGDPYNGEYAKQFLDRTSQLLPRGVPWNISIHEAVNEKDKTVDVTLRFTAR
ncbi:MAG TPA: POTRA domain-containing protein [Terriglobales bacterium]|nr:POTRA domain-containing protein [Terriglobales bacterium]